ncbi:unnamed protein product [Rotaria sordida]|uniref:Uncharacterized protein n=1 Tax=Rotaria sordida TaxID=392033 RepID=A0A814ZQA3_9BILA|nr:unnamed protein product [Rotaria sordida]CAF1528061.1 unnamed protein product [Rotaria sordida]
MGNKRNTKRSYRRRKLVKNLRSKSKSSISTAPSPLSPTTNKHFSPQIPGSKRYDINVRAQLAGHLTVIQSFTRESMSTAIREATDADKSNDITVTGDGT